MQPLGKTLSFHRQNTHIHILFHKNTGIIIFIALLKEVTEWEDFDDDLPEKKAIGFQTGFKNNAVIREGIDENSK